MPSRTGAAPQPGAQPTDHDRPHAVLYSVTVTTPSTGHVDTVQVHARTAESAFPIACAWYPQLPLTGADVEVVRVSD